MKDARGPLFASDLTFQPLPTGGFSLWNDGEEKVRPSITELRALGSDFGSGVTPGWFVGKADPKAGAVLASVADKMDKVGVIPTLSALYGGDPLGPANPDTRKAGAFIDDEGNVTWTI